MTQQPEDAGSSDVLRVTHGDPTAEELAALVVALLGRQHGAAATSVSTPARSGWNDRARNMPVMPRPGPGAWRASAQPR